MKFYYSSTPEDYEEFGFATAVKTRFGKTAYFRLVMTFLISFYVLLALFILLGVMFILSGMKERTDFIWVMGALTALLGAIYLSVVRYGLMLLDKRYRAMPPERNEIQIDETGVRSVDLMTGQDIYTPWEQIDLSIRTDRLYIFVLKNKIGIFFSRESAAGAATELEALAVSRMGKDFLRRKS